LVVGVDPSEGFLRKAKEQLAGRVQLHLGTAAEIPLKGSSVDVTCSGLVLNFAPDARAALAEMLRVTCSGGTIGAYDPTRDPQPKQSSPHLFFRAAVAVLARLRL
jgi:ubiquinone/menaquinone biosynthesis C-methylase UbiE